MISVWQEKSVSFGIYQWPNLGALRIPGDCRIRIHCIRIWWVPQVIKNFKLCQSDSGMIPLWLINYSAQYWISLFQPIENVIRQLLGNLTSLSNRIFLIVRQGTAKTGILVRPKWSQHSAVSTCPCYPWDIAPVRSEQQECYLHLCLSRG